MKNKLMYLVAVLFAACVGFSSCSDDDDDDAGLEGNYKYDNVHFKFEYAKETISVPEGLIPPGSELILGSLTEIPVSVVNDYLPAFAHGQMQKYFNGIKFDQKGNMEVSYNLDEKAETLKTTYELKGSMINVSLKSDDFKKLIGSDLPVSYISFNYKLENNQLTMYLNTEYIKTLATAVPLILKTSSLTPEKQEMVSELVSELITNTKVLEIGAILKAE